MEANALAKKLKLKEHTRAAIINAPDGYLASLDPLPAGVSVTESLDGLYTWIQIFVKTRAEFAALFPQVAAALEPESMLWISFPKGSSKMQTDLTRDKGWDALQGSTLRWLTLVSVNETWSAFSMRPSRPGEPPQAFR